MTKERVVLFIFEVYDVTANVTLSNLLVCDIFLDGLYIYGTENGNRNSIASK